MTHTPKCPERDRERQTGSCAFLPGFFITFSVLHDLCHKISHGLRCPILLLPGGVGVGTQGEACVVVPQHAADRFHVYTILECQGRECVPLWHNKYVQFSGASRCPTVVANRCNSTSSIFITSAVKDRKVPSGGKSRTREADDAAIFA